MNFFFFFFVLLSIWAVHNQVGVVWDCKEMPVTNPPLLSGDQINAQHRKAWNRKTLTHTGGQNPWHLPACVLGLIFLSESWPCQINSSRQQKCDGCWRNAVPLLYLRKPAVETQFLLARISTFLNFNHFSYLAFLQSSLKGRDKQEYLSSRNDIALLCSLMLQVTVWHLATM